MTFNNFFEAEGAAQAVALRFMDGSPGIVLIKARNAGNAATLREKIWINNLYQQAYRAAYNKALSSFIQAGIVRDCRMSRRFMAGLPAC
jgi:hypothetical protein